MILHCSGLPPSSPSRRGEEGRSSEWHAAALGSVFCLLGGDESHAPEWCKIALEWAAPGAFASLAPPAPDPTLHARCRSILWRETTGLGSKCNYSQCCSFFTMWRVKQPYLCDALWYIHSKIQKTLLVMSSVWHITEINEFLIGLSAGRSLQDWSTSSQQGTSNKKEKRACTHTHTRTHTQPAILPLGAPMILSENAAT